MAWATKDFLNLSVEHYSDGSLPLNMLFYLSNVLKEEGGNVGWSTVYI